MRPMQIATRIRDLRWGRNFRVRTDTNGPKRLLYFKPQYHDWKETGCKCRGDVRAFGSAVGAV
jgi:hypothetical protein